MEECWLKERSTPAERGGQQRAGPCGVGSGAHEAAGGGTRRATPALRRCPGTAGSAARRDLGCRGAAEAAPAHRLGARKVASLGAGSGCAGGCTTREGAVASARKRGWGPALGFLPGLPHAARQTAGSTSAPASDRSSSKRAQRRTQPASLLHRACSSARRGPGRPAGQPCTRHSCGS